MMTRILNYIDEGKITRLQLKRFTNLQLVYYTIISTFDIPSKNGDDTAVNMHNNDN